MSASAWDQFQQRLSCEDSWHADCETLPWPPSEERLARLAERNAVHLATIAALEERRGEPGEEDSPVMQELGRLDAKLTALIEMVNRLALPASMLPARQPIRFNALGAWVPAAMLPAQGEGALLRLRFDVCRSLPLELPAHIERRFPDGHAFLAFGPLGDGVFASLERLVFRHHRRKVAGTRQGLA